MQTTCIAATAWIYFIRHYGDQETATKITSYVYHPTLFLSGLSTFYGKLVLCMYLCMLSRQKILTFPIDCCILHRAFRGLSSFEPPADIRSTQTLTAACVNMSATFFLMQNFTNPLNRTDSKASGYTSVSNSLTYLISHSY